MEAVKTASVAATIGAPVTHARLLELIVETAVHVISATAGALLLKDEDADELVFEVAVGGKAEEVRRFRVPLGHGIAGLVAATGQPVSIANTEGAPIARDIADRVGYLPRNVLCVPLFYDDEVIGVLELMDKQDGDAFDPGDMTALSLFAAQAAIAIEQSRVHRSVRAILDDALSLVVAADGTGSLEDEAVTVAADIDGDESFRQTLELARLVQEVARRGEREREACQAILSAFASYAGSMPVG